jgi:hypothetical protein
MRPDVLGSAAAGVPFNALHEFDPFDADQIRQERIREMNNAFPAFSNPWLSDFSDLIRVQKNPS